MRTYRYRYESVTYFSYPVSFHSFLLRPVPLQDQVQTLLESSLEIQRKEGGFSVGKDAWGATLCYGLIREPHVQFRYISSGIVSVSGECRSEMTVSPVLRLHTHLTEYTPDMASLEADSEDPLEFALGTAANIAADLEYMKGSTSVSTTSVDAFRQRSGVCQDFSHILLAICRHRGIASRYVCGFVEGEGETHAWAEVWKEGFWYAIDPTSGKRCDHRYITVATGRDASDTSVSRGVFQGAVTQTTITSVKVEEITSDDKDNI